MSWKETGFRVSQTSCFSQRHSRTAKHRPCRIIRSLQVLISHTSRKRTKTHTTPTKARRSLVDGAQKMQGGSSKSSSSCCKCRMEVRTTLVRGLYSPVTTSLISTYRQSWSTRSWPLCKEARLKFWLSTTRSISHWRQLRRTTSCCSKWCYRTREMQSMSATGSKASLVALCSTWSTGSSMQARSPKSLQSWSITRESKSCLHRTHGCHCSRVNQTWKAKMWLIWVTVRKHCRSKLWATSRALR